MRMSDACGGEDGSTAAAAGVADLTGPGPGPDRAAILRPRGRLVQSTANGSGSTATVACGPYDASRPSREPTRTSSVEPQVSSPSNVAESILGHLARDMLACDVQLSLFVGAARSYRHDSSLSPFPPGFLTSTGEKDIGALQEAITTVPPLSQLQRQLEQHSYQLSLRTLQLLLWLFDGGPTQLTLRSLPRHEHSNVLARAGIVIRPTHGEPTYLLEVCNANTNTWCLKCENEETFYAFHGSRLDNWFSILSNGLQQHRAKTSLFGEGIYLAKELGVSLNYSTRGVAWDNSSLGTFVSCLAVAEVIHHPSVKIHSETPRGRVEGSEGGSLPRNYILVRNNQLVNIRYIMLYADQHLARPAGQTARSSRLRTWLAANKLALVLGGYGVLLLLVGLSTSSWFKRAIRKLGQL